MRVCIFFKALLLIGSAQAESLVHLAVEPTMSYTSMLEADLQFVCKHEVVPVSQPDVAVLFRYARWMQTSNQLKQSPEATAEVERLYRIAAEHGHAGANINLQNGSLRGRFDLRPYEQLRLSQDLIDMGVSSGYYFIAIFLQRGAAGLEQNEEMALRYYRKAADEGSPQAQHYVAQRLEPVDASPDIAFKMYRCAAEQGNGRSASILGIHLKQIGDYEEAIRAFQMGALAGDDLAAGLLEEAFRGPQPDDKLYYVGQQEDLERAYRYKEVWRVLANYSYASPKVPEINKILPLPPAKLPAWDGKLQWLEEHIANLSPPKPEEWLIEKLAKEKGLDPATGRPQPGSPAFKAEYFPADTCRSGEPCPQEGYWKVMWPESWVHNEEIIQHFNEGDLMPNPEGNYYIHRVWPLPRKLVQGQIAVEWGLLG